MPQPAAFAGLLLICMAAFSHTAVSSSQSIDAAAVESDRKCPALLMALGESWPPKGHDCGLYEIPPICWGDAIRELKPVKVYDHLLNVAIVLRIREGEEEGIYIQNIISSFWPMPGRIWEDGFEFIPDPNQSLLRFRRHRPPSFEDYPVTAVFKGALAYPQTVPSPEAQDIERIRNGIAKGLGVFHGSEEKRGPNFAGHFTLVRWSCGASCLGAAIVDAKTGDVFPPPGTGNCIANFHLPSLNYPGPLSRNPELEYRVDSNLLILRNNNPVGLPYTFYYLWQGNRWTLLRRMPLRQME